jgi:ABC-type polysaccharide/polyol phosphate transport system ATPase subunit
MTNDERPMPPQLRIRLENVSLDFPVHPYTNRSIKDWLWRTVKGGLGSGAVERFRALHEVSLELSDGDCLGVVGHNGSGKSSLLRVIAGIYRPDAGRVWVRGRLCSLLSLGAGFEPEMPGRDNIYLNGLLLGIPRGEIADRVDWIIEFSGLGEFIDRPVKTYSTGMAARLGFAIACCLQPEVLMLDEVFSVGDAAFIARAERAM